SGRSSSQRLPRGISCIKRASNGFESGFYHAPRLWRNGETGFLVGSAANHLYRIWFVCRLYDMGGGLGWTLPFLALPLPFVSTGAIVFGHCLVRPETGVVSDMDAVHSRAADSLGSRRISFYLLLLSGSLLQSVLGGSAGLCSG